MDEILEEIHYVHDVHSVHFVHEIAVSLPQKNNSKKQTKLEILSRFT